MFDYTNLICIHLTSLRSLTEIDEMIENMEFTNMDADELWQMKKNGIQKIWLDASSLDLVYWIDRENGRKNILINEDYISGLREMKSISYKKVKKSDFALTTDKTESNIDSILDKINEHGIDSLTKKERDILDNAK